MAIKFKSEQGYVVYRCILPEIRSWGGLGICDFCGKFNRIGYLVPVLNSCICPSCFDEWNNAHTMYPEDLPYEKQKCDYYERILKIEGE